MANKELYNVLVDITLKPYGHTEEHIDPDTKEPVEVFVEDVANLSTSEEDVAVALGKLHAWYANFKPCVFDAPVVVYEDIGDQPRPTTVFGFHDTISFDYGSDHSWFIQRAEIPTTDHRHIYVASENLTDGNWWHDRYSYDLEARPDYIKHAFTTFFARAQSEWVPGVSTIEHVGVHLGCGDFTNSYAEYTDYGSSACELTGYPHMQADLVFFRDNNAPFVRTQNQPYSATDPHTAYWENWHALLLPENIVAGDNSITVGTIDYSMNIPIFQTMDGKLYQDVYTDAIPYRLTLSHANTVTAQATSGMYKFTYDANGHITGSTAVQKSDITSLGIPGSNTDTKVTQTAITNISAYTNYRPLVISNASSANKPFTPATTTAETYISPNIYCRPSSGIIYAAGRGFTQFAIQTDATVKQSAVDFETLMTWLLTNKYIPTGEAAHVILETTWSYADNDYLLLTVDGTNYQIFLAGCTIEFIGYAAAYNNGVFRFIIHTAPAKASVTPASGYTFLDTAQVLEYWFNGTNYDPRWKIYATTSDIGSAGSVTRPVYFSNGKPIAVTQPATGAWWSSVPKIDSSGVLEIGKFIDFHTTATSTNNYDYRIYTSAATAVFQASNVDSTQITLTSGGYTSLRFDTSASGKASSAAIIQAYPLTTSGEVMLMQSGGNTVIGAGEFATNAYVRKDSTGTNAVGYDSLATAENEDLYLGADADVHIIAKGQNIGTYSNTDHKEWLFNVSGELNCPNAVNIMKNAAGVRLTDNSGALYPGIWDNGSNLWIGADRQTGTAHHVGGTYISTGYDSTNRVGNETIWICVPNATNTGSSPYRAVHTGNLFSLVNNSGIFYNDNTDATTAQNNPWQCIAEATVTASGNTYISTTFLIDSTFSSYPGTGIVHFRASIKLTAAESYCVYTLKWLTSDTNVNDSTIVFTYKVVSNTSCAVKVWAKAAKRYEAIHIHPLYEATRAAARSSEFWTYNVNSSGVASIPSDEHAMTSTTKQVLLHESASSTATSLECTVTDLFKIWQVVYVCIQNLSYGSGSNPMSINFLVPLGYVKSKSNYNAAISTSNPGYYVGEGYNPSNTGTSHTRMLVQWKNDNTIVFTNGSGNRMGIVRIYGIS